MSATTIAIIGVALMHIPTWIAIARLFRWQRAHDREVRISHETARVPVPQRADGGVNITMKHTDIVGAA